MKRPPVKCMGGLYPFPDGSGYQFNVIRNKEHGWFVWEGNTIPDQFKKGEGHIYEVYWSDEFVRLVLVEERPLLKLLPLPIWPLDEYVMTPTDNNFYVLRNRIREVGREASRTDFENLIKKEAPNLVVGELPIL